MEVVLRILVAVKVYHVKENNLNLHGCVWKIADLRVWMLDPRVFQDELMRSLGDGPRKLLFLGQDSHYSRLRGVSTALLTNRIEFKLY